MPGLMETSRKLIKEIFLPRSKTSKKGDYGKLLVVGGSDKYTGSAALVSLAAYSAGCDLVLNAAPKRAADTMASFSPEIITHPLNGDYLKKEHVKIILNLADWADAVVIGNGLGTEKNTMDAVVGIISKTKKPIVVDADGIKSFPPKKHKILAGKDVIITPHSYEMSVFSGKKIDTDLQKRIDLCKDLANSLKITIILKGNVDVIAADGKVAINKTGNSYMTVGGTGDTLAGICGSLLARGVDNFSSASAATMLNGLAGDLCAKEWGEGLTASRMIDYIPKAIMSAV